MCERVCLNFKRSIKRNEDFFSLQNGIALSKIHQNTSFLFLWCHFFITTLEKEEILTFFKTITIFANVSFSFTRTLPLSLTHTLTHTRRHTLLSTHISLSLISFNLVLYSLCDLLHILSQCFPIWCRLLQQKPFSGSLSSVQYLLFKSLTLSSFHRFVPQKILPERYFDIERSFAHPRVNFTN